MNLFAFAATIKQLLFKCQGPTSISASIPPALAVLQLPGFRNALRALQFTPYPALYHGVVHLEVRVSMLETTEFTRCEIGPWEEKSVLRHGGRQDDKICFCLI